MESRSRDQATRPSLLYRLRDASDAEAWQTFVDVYAPLVYGYGRKLGLQDADAADVAQDVLTQMLHTMRAFEYDPAQGRFRDWLRVVTRRRVFKFIASRDRIEMEPLDQAHEQAANRADSEWSDDFSTHVLQVAIERVRPYFEPSTWGAFQRLWIEGGRAPQVARELELPIELVYAAKSRVLRRLRDEILELAEDLPQCFPLNRSPWS